MPPTSISIVDRIKRAYYQCHQWLNSPFIESDNLGVSDFGYALNDDLNITPSIQYVVIPDDFPCKLFVHVESNRYHAVTSVSANATNNEKMTIN